MNNNNNYDDDDDDDDNNDSNNDNIDDEDGLLAFQWPRLLYAKTVHDCTVITCCYIVLFQLNV